MDDWSHVVTQSPPAMTMPTRQPRASISSRLGLLLLTATVVVASAVLLLMLQQHHRTPSLSPLDRPSGGRPLVTSMITHDPMGGPSFHIDLPAAPQPGSVATQPGSDGSVDFGGIRLGGSQFGALLLVKGGNSWSASPRQSLKQEIARAGASGAGVLTPVGPIRGTLVGSTPAYACEFVLKNGQHLREFRFSHDGHVYGAGIMYANGDAISLNTALEALRTLRWIT